MTDDDTPAVEVTVNVPDTEPEPAPHSVVVVQGTATTSSDALDAVLVADAIESAEFDADIESRIEKLEENVTELQAAAAITAVVALTVAEEAEQAVEEAEQAVEETDLEPADDTAPNRDHPFYRDFFGGKN